MSDKYVDEAGEYIVVVKKPGNGWFGEAGENKTPFIRIPLLVTEKGKQTNREIVWRGYITENAIKRTIKTLREAFNFNGDLDILAHEQENDYVDSVFVGKECAVTCEEEFYNDKPRIRAKWLNPINTDKLLSADKVGSIVARFGKLALAAAAEDESESSSDSQDCEEPPKRRGRKPAEKYEGRKTDDNGDDIPF